MTIKEKVNNRVPLFGTHVNLCDPIVTEILGSLGYDYLFVDLEHTSLNSQDIYYHILAAKSVGTPIFVRVPVDDLTLTKKVLEMGIDGIIFPMVKDAEHARQLLANTLYPPYGKRGCGPRGAVKYGLESEDDYYKENHLKLCRFVQIELKSAAEDAENIAALPYLDGCVLGMHDLSGSINRLGDVFCEENIALAQKAIDAFHKCGKAVSVSTYATDSETLQRYADMGIDIISSGADYVHLINEGKKTLENLKNIKRKRS